MSLRTLIRTLAAAVAALALGAAWLVLAPPELGGQTSIVVTSGSSMEPGIHRGDLALVRERGEFSVGDVVLYASRELHRSVLHRIVARDGDAFVTKGDNNDFRDGEHPSPGQVQGELWVVVPGVGRAIEWLQQPSYLAIILFVLVFGSLAGGLRMSKRHAAPAARPLLPGKPSAPRRPSDAVATAARGTIVPAGIGLALFSLLAVLAWSSDGCA